jgi:hypothetical protein
MLEPQSRRRHHKARYGSLIAGQDSLPVVLTRLKTGAYSAILNDLVRFELMFIFLDLVLRFRADFLKGLANIHE